MLSRLIKKEVLEHLMSLRFAIACLLCLIVILCSLFVRCQDYAQVLDDWRQEVAMESYRINTMRTPWSLPYEGVLVHLQPNPMKIFVRGTADANGAALRVNTRHRVEPIIGRLQNTSVPLFQAIDMVCFVGLILSLMAIVFGYDAVCGEKERGTLRLMLSYSVPRHQVLLAKWLGGYAVLILPFLLTGLAGAVIVLIQPDISLDPGQWLRLGGIMALAMLYVAVMFSLAITVSTLTGRASTSVMLLLTVWVVLVLAAPNLSPHVAQALLPAANAQEIDSARAAASRQIWDELDEKMKQYRKAHGLQPELWWEAVNWDSWEDMAKVYDMWIYGWPLEKQASLRVLAEYAKIEQQHEQRMNAQIELSRWLSRLSPFSCFALAATELSDEGLLQQRRHRDQLRTYQEQFSVYAHDEGLAMEKKYQANKGKSPGLWCSMREKPLPAFRYVSPAGGDYVRMTLLDGGILAGATLLLFMLGYLAFLRYDVR